MPEKKFVFITADFPGVVAFDRDKEIVDAVPFDKEPEEILESLEALKEGKSIPELEKLLERLDTENIVTEFPLQSKNFNIEIKDEISASEYLSSNMRKVSKDIGFVDEDKEFNEFMRDVQIIRTKDKIKSSVEKDEFMVQAVSAFGDLRDISNELSERLREWYGLYYPELEINSNEKYAELVSKLGERDQFDEFEGSMGMDLDREDVEILQKFAGELKKIFDLKEEIDSYLEDSMPEVAPNLTHIIGAKMSAKLISLAGSLEDLAKMPSSKIQLLGAEKALFRHLKGGGKPPKYGVIYNHPYIQNTPEGKRGKVARAIASKLMMAARTDYYTEDFKAEKYKKELEEKIQDIRKG